MFKFTWDREWLKKLKGGRKVKFFQKFENHCTRQKEKVLRLNNIVRIMNWRRKFDHVSVLYKQLKLLKLQDIYKLELSKFMH